MKPKQKQKKKKKATSRSRRLSLRIGICLAVFLLLWCVTGVWFVQHPRAWHAHARETWPAFLVRGLSSVGNPIGDVTDGLGWTGHDAVYDIDEEAPSGSVLFAGAPVRTGAPAPDDIVILDRGHFKIGWSNKLRHPVWCAYHVVRDARYPSLKRPGFLLDNAVSRAPRPADFTHSGYDRGHLAPNYAIVTRYGEAEQRKTFLMANITPQSPALNRGVWRDVEHRIADLWTARYGEIWVVVGCIPSRHRETLPNTDIDVPSKFFQVILAQEGTDVRALAMVFPQNIPWNAWAVRNLVTIDELEEMTGLDFNPDMPSFIQDPLEAELPTRLWPVRPADIFKQIMLRYTY